VHGPGRTGLPAALEPHGLFSTGDRATAERLGTPLFGRVRLVSSDDQPERFRATLHAVVAGPVTLAYLHVATATRLEVGGSAPRVLVVEPAEGLTPVRCGATSFEATPDAAAVLQPGRPTTLWCPAGCGYLIVGIEREALVVHLSRLLGRAPEGPLAFSPRLDLAGAASSRWNLAVGVLLAELVEPGSLLRRGIGNGQLSEFLMSALLFGHQSSCSDLLSAPPPGPERRTTSAAKGYIEAHLAERLTLSAVAGAAGVSVRTLEAAFRSDLRTTPTAFIRSRRLERARADLLEADAAEGDRVTDVATRWGISHLGRFAAEYRARFGESPSHTLRRSRA
jgi:AraC-like DNA-binding protein